jgi:hypothetical protein
MLQIAITTGDSTVKLSTTRQFINTQKCTLYEERLGWQTHRQYSKAINV